MSDGAKIIRGPWSRVGQGGAEHDGPAAPAAGAGPVASPAPLPASEGAPGRMHLGFIVRECTIALGRRPTPGELADWANHQVDGRGEFCLFGRRISTDEARLILRHPGREVSVRPERARSGPPRGHEPGAR